MKTKHCPKCNKDLEATSENFQKNRTMKDGFEYWCKDCKSKSHRELSQRRAAEGLCHCGRPKKNDYKTCEICQARVAAWMLAHPQEKHDGQKAWRENIKKQVFDHYGRICRCCGETIEQFLTIDHINGNGRQHIKEAGMPLYHWIVKHSFPEDLRTLCWNCNCGRRINGGICPHETERAKIEES